MRTVRERVGARELLVVAEEAARAASWSGVDPYDGLSGARVPQALRSAWRGRQSVIQLAKRCPWVRAPLGVAPRRFAKADACLVAGYVRLWELTGEQLYRDSADELLGDLEAKRIGSRERACWGYEFDVQTRWAFYPAGSPNIIVTTFAAHALLDAADAFCDQEAATLALKAALFVAEELVGRTDAGLPYIRYAVGVDKLVHNANVLGAGVLARVGKRFGRDDLRALAAEVAATTFDSGAEPGMWPYGEGSLGWTDSYHTGYIIDGLAWVLDGHVAKWNRLLRESLRAYIVRFFEEDGLPRFGPDRRYPVDIHSAATAIDVLSRLAWVDTEALPLASKIAAWTGLHMLTSDGMFFFQLHRFYKDRTPYMRWGQAHMLKALACLAAAEAAGEGGSRTVAVARLESRAAGSASD